MKFINPLFIAFKKAILTKEFKIFFPFNVMG